MHGEGAAARWSRDTYHAAVPTIPTRASAAITKRLEEKKWDIEMKGKQTRVHTTFSNGEEHELGICLRSMD